MDRSPLGRGWSFPPRFDAGTKELVMVDGVADIEESLRILLSTHPGERVLEPSFGCGLRRFLFERMDEQNLADLTEVITQSILFFEPRIHLEGIDADLVEGPAQGLRLNLRYTVRATQTTHELVLPLALGQDGGPEPED